MRAVGVRCIACQERHPLGERYHYTCPSCGGILEVQYDFGSHAVVADAMRCSGRSLWDYRDMLPVKTDTPVTLGEGGTPLLRSRRIGKSLGMERLYFKDETGNPSGSFKDRPTSVAITRAQELGYETVIIASSGNAGAAAAAYAAAANLRCIVLVPASTPVEKLTQAAAYGAEIFVVQAPYSECFRLAQELANQHGWVNITSTFLSPFPTEGDKTVAYELYRDLEGVVPDWIFIPVGSGPLLAGVYRGYKELREAGLVDRLPRMVAVQAEGCAPIAEAFEAGEEKVRGWTAPQTIASGINDGLVGYEQDGTYCLSLVRESMGAAVAVSDDDILAATQALAQEEGIFAETTGAVGIPALQTLLEDGMAQREELAVCVVTGSGFKTMQAFSEETNQPRRVAARVEALKQLIGVK